MNPQTVGTPGRAAYANPNDNSLYVFRSLYIYEVDILANYPAGLAPGQSANLNFNVAKDSDFFWTKFGVLATVGGAATVPEELPYVNMTLINATNGRQYMNNPVPLVNIAGSGRLPFILPIATLWEALTTIQITLQNVGDDTYSNLQLSFIGIKAFLKPQTP